MSGFRSSRRKFIKSAVLGAGGCLLTGTTAASKSSPTRGIQSPPAAVRRVLGRTGFNLPVIGMGVMNADNPNLVKAALKAGIELLDTAHEYQRGRNEEMLGRVLKGRPRDSFVLATKVYLPCNEKTGLYPGKITSDDFIRLFDLSMKRLGLEHVDILYHHSVWKKESVTFEPILQALVRLKKEGRTRFIGISTHKNEPEVLDAAVEAKVYDVVLTAYHYRQKHREEVKAAIGRAAASGLGVVGMKALGGARLASGQPVNAKAALKWVLKDPNVHAVIPGFTTFDQLQTDCSVMEDLTLTDEEERDLASFALDPGLYCQGCLKCLDRCVQGLPVPELMRAFMYAYGYRNLSAAQDLILGLNVPDRACSKCRVCAVRCTSGFDVKSKIEDVIRLRQVPPEFLV